MSIIDGPRVVTSGLVLNLDAANTKSYPGSGITWTDLTGNGNTCTLTNGPTFSSGKGGQIVFDGTNDFALYSTSTVADNLANMTVSVWAYYNHPVTTGPSYAYVPIVTKQNSVINGIGWEFDFDSHIVNRQTFAFITQDLNGTRYRVTFGDVPSGAYWANYVATLSGGINNNSILYLNGKTVTTQIVNAGTIVSMSNNYKICIAGRDSPNDPADTVKYAPVTIGNVSIYNRALTAAEIAQNFNALRGRYGI
jgi:hypothetical protein